MSQCSAGSCRAGATATSPPPTRLSPLSCSGARSPSGSRNHCCPPLSKNPPGSVTRPARCRSAAGSRRWSAVGPSAGALEDATRDDLGVVVAVVLRRDGPQDLCEAEGAADLGDTRVGQSLRRAHQGGRAAGEFLDSFLEKDELVADLFCGGFSQVFVCPGVVGQFMPLGGLSSYECRTGQSVLSQEEERRVDALRPEDVQQARRVGARARIERQGDAVDPATVDGYRPYGSR